MTYRERLEYWAVARLLPTGQWVILARFHRRADAEGHCQFMQQANPEIRFEVVFDLPPAPLAAKPLPKPRSR
ncbi:MAG: hypothetical protein KME07_20925 [Pegethrix bostrychoides GSE-TBD4-15B]|uniref:Uncharacterized protein n=1 Tax=Pegethrix bostrychoides GSE-TBD4-15B TaxID=2839662 RepID=A0A951U7W2_9CYAN|nr:hypothetical protein [Pegethrix bostrychoides GSE-TBD4-15B]